MADEPGDPELVKHEQIGVTQTEDDNEVSDVNDNESQPQEEQEEPDQAEVDKSQEDGYYIENIPQEVDHNFKVIEEAQNDTDTDCDQNENDRGENENEDDVEKDENDNATGEDYEDNILQQMDKNVNNFDEDKSDHSESNKHQEIQVLVVNLNLTIS